MLTKSPNQRGCQKVREMLPKSEIDHVTSAENQVTLREIAIKLTSELRCSATRSGSLTPCTGAVSRPLVLCRQHLELLYWIRWSLFVWSERPRLFLRRRGLRRRRRRGGSRYNYVCILLFGIEVEPSLGPVTNISMCWTSVLVLFVRVTLRFIQCNLLTKRSVNSINVTSSVVVRDLVMIEEGESYGEG